MTLETQQTESYAITDTKEGIIMNEDGSGMMRICKKYGCSPHQWGDYAKQEKNEASGSPLCEKCGGTGNQLFSMYQKCEDCDGTGVKP